MAGRIMRKIVTLLPKSKSGIIQVDKDEEYSYPKADKIWEMIFPKKAARRYFWQTSLPVLIHVELDIIYEEHYD
jgi:hypothetical protein